MPEKLLPTTVVGSYPQPDWLIDRSRLADWVGTAAAEVTPVYERMKSRTPTRPGAEVLR